MRGLLTDKELFEANSDTRHGKQTRTMFDTGFLKALALRDSQRVCWQCENCVTDAFSYRCNVNPFWIEDPYEQSCRSNWIPRKEGYQSE